MRLTVRQVTYLLDNGHIKVQEFDTIACRQEPFPSHLMLLQKAGLMSWEEVEKYEADINWTMDNLLQETEADKALLGKYDHKFTQYLREQLASTKINRYQSLVIMWKRVEYNIPELVKYIYVKRLERFGITFKSKALNDDGDEVYYFNISSSTVDSKTFSF